MADVVAVMDVDKETNIVANMVACKVAYLKRGVQKEDLVTQVDPS